VETRQLSKEEALQKLRHYCAYQERCHQEVKEKLYSYGLHKADTEASIAQLIEENYLNEERFAIHFAGGKFRMKHWGKVKISRELKARQVSDYCIRKALKEIDGKEYNDCFEKLAQQKWKTLGSEKNIFRKKRKLQDYLLAKGYESEMIFDIIRSLSS
jgi:regulatory protein